MDAGYKMTEVGLTPSDWVLYRIGDVSISYSGGTPNTSIPEYYKGNINWITSSELNKGRIRETEGYISLSGLNNSSAKVVENGTFLLAMYGATAGVSAVSEISGAINQAILAITSEKVGAEYLFQYFSLFKEKIINTYTQGGQPNLSGHIIRSIRIPLPPTLTEQKAIAAALYDVDDLITRLDKLIEKKKAIKQGAMQGLLSGKIRLAGFHNEAGYKMTEVGNIPNDWEVKMLPEVVDFIHGKAHEQHIDKFGQYVVVNSKFISSEGSVIKNSNENFCPGKKGDVLTVLSDLPNGKALAKCYYVEKDNHYAVNQRVCILRSKQPSSKFLFFIMNRNKYFLKFDDGVTQTHILNHHIRKCPIPLPPTIEEQEAIASALFSMISEIKELEVKRDKYKLIKQGMMQELLTGKTRLI